MALLRRENERFNNHRGGTGWSYNITDIDEIEIESDDEVVSDDDPLTEIGKNDQDDDSEEIDIDDNVSFIDDDLNDEDENEEIEDTKQ